ncbi:peptide/nickel transport system permease protein [Rhizobiales bacterium GAS191]|nr:peptide/nickel transport system permease protein [Rhizobiales bacterium GAS113]SEE70019.1 peptide/nickel transport system permease protein [Rhizobiales bacterium GAS191]
MSGAFETAPAAALGAASAKPTRFLTRLLRKPLALASLGWIALIVIGSAFAARLAPYDPLDQDLLGLKQMPSPEHWLGTDALGRDVLSRLLYGGMPTLEGIMQAVVVASVLGVGLGVTAGYFGGWFDRLVNQLVDLVLSLPTIVILLSVLAVFHHDMLAAMVAVGFLGSAGITRVIRSVTLGIRGELYLEAARISGLSDGAIIFRHVIPRIMGPVLVQLSLFAAVTVLIQTGISFLGLGVPPPDPSWGGMIFDASVSLNDFPWLLVPSGVTAALTILAFGLLGDSARDAAAEGWSKPVAGRRPLPAAGRRESAPAAVPAPADPNSVLSVRGLTIVGSTGREEVRRLVNNVSLDLAPGETLGIVGESGSGKTMTILSLLGLLPKGAHVVEGAMAIDGRRVDLTDESSLKRLRGQTISMIFQEPMSALDPCATIGRHLAEVIHRFEKVSRGEAHKRVIEMLRQVQIPNPEEVAKRYPHEISGGMAQRVAIARALAPRPKVLLADEPTTALDVTVQAEILDLLRGLSQRHGMAIILVTHDWGVVADICDRAAVLYNGDLLECAPVTELFSNPQHPYTAALLKSNPHSAPVGVPLPTIQDTLARMREARA